MNTLPATQAAAALLDYSDPEMVKTLKATVALGATDAEFAMFAGLAKSTGLNPFKREIWFIKTPGYTKKDGTRTDAKVQIMTGILGFLAIANSHPQYDGMECDIERGKDGKPVKAVAKVYRKDRRFPAVAEAIWLEDSQPTESYHGKPTIWGKMPSVMLAKVAKSRALREAFPQELGGLYTQEEMPAEYSIERTDEETKTASESAKPANGQPQNGTSARTFPANEHYEPDTEPSQYVLKSGNKRVQGKMLSYVHADNPKWIGQIMEAPKVLAMYHPQDQANIKAFADELTEKEAAMAAEECKKAFDGDDMPEWGEAQSADAAAEADKIMASRGFK
jgi:phage recombination protein Bet